MSIRKSYDHPNFKNIKYTGTGILKKNNIVKHSTLNFHRILFGS
ncbi:hypothetical protein QF004_001078 [Chryseobacterium sp. MDT2-18]|nr:hypothetical protein [Chryseobacterium sp. MDT2-18]